MITDDHPFIRKPFRPGRLEPCFCGSGRKFRSCCGSLAAERKPPHGLVLKPAFLASETAAQWCQVLEQQPRHPLGVIGVDREDGTLRQENPAARITDRVDAAPLQNDINRLLKTVFEQFFPGTDGRPVEWFEQPQVLRYEPGGWYGRHADSEIYLEQGDRWAKNIDRDISLLLYLNEGYEGGEIVFERFNFSHRPAVGDLLLFPSDSRYVHTARPVTSGVRYAVVSWAALAGGPRVFNHPPEESILLPHVQRGKE